MNSTGSSTNRSSLEMPWFNLCREAGPWGAGGLWEQKGPTRAAVLGACGAGELPRAPVTSSAGGVKALTWAGPHWERSGIGRPGATSRVLQTLPSLPSRSKTAQVQPSPPLLSQSSPTPLTILPHDVRVRPSEKNRRVDVFRVVFFFRECFCSLPVPCETSHAAPTAAELLFFSTSPSPGDVR